MASRLTLFAWVIFCASTTAQNIPKGFFIPEDSLSPDHRYGVTVPVYAELGEKEIEPANSLVEVKTGRVLAAINADTGWDHVNHRSVLPARWSPDNTLLLWEVDGKWFPAALVLLKLEKGQLLWQCNILQEGQKAILAQTKKAFPEKYAQAKEAIKGSGSAYPEGFSVDVEVKGPLALPLQILVNLTSNPKGIEELITLESHLEGTVDAQGKFTVKNFKSGPSPDHNF